MHVFAKNTLFSIDSESMYNQQHFFGDISRWWTDPQVEFDLLSHKCGECGELKQIFL